MVDGVVGEFLSGSLCSLGARYRLSGFCDPAYRPVLAQLREDVAADRNSRTTRRTMPMTWPEAGWAVEAATAVVVTIKKRE